jgi:SulP family sulfate permease
MAGITVAVMFVPQGMAYALLAGLPPIYGLYTGIVPLFLYAFFGSSRHLSVGPVALVSLLVLSGLSEFAEPQSAEFVSLAITTALIAGSIQLILGGLRLGFLINFLSHPVIVGFTSAAALIIGFSQVKNLLGIDLGRSNKIHIVIQDAITHIQDIHWPTFIIGILGIALIAFLKKWNRKLPGALIAVVISTIVVYVFSLHKSGVSIVGDVPQGLPGFLMPDLSVDRIQQLFPLALTICLISFIESLAISKSIEAKEKNYRVEPNQELFALGITKIGGAFFQSFPTTGSFTRSAINHQSGAKTGISSIISALLIAMTLLLLTPLFYYLPKAILASIIVMAVTSLINFKEIKELWVYDRKDLLTLIATFLVTITIGVQEGVLTGVVLSLAFIIYQNSRPHVAVLGQLPDTHHYRNITNFPQAIQRDDVLIGRFDAQLYFGNASYFRDIFESFVQDKETSLRYFILDASGISDMDSSGVHILKDFVKYLRSKQIEFVIAGCIGPMRDLFVKTSLFELIHQDHFFLTVKDAMDQIKEDKLIKHT